LATPEKRKKSGIDQICESSFMGMPFMLAIYKKHSDHRSQSGTLGSNWTCKSRPVISVSSRTVYSHDLEKTIISPKHQKFDKILKSVGFKAKFSTLNQILSICGAFCAGCFIRQCQATCLTNAIFRFSSAVSSN